MTPRLLRLRRQAPPPPQPVNPILSQHQAFIRALPCSACGKPAPSECACVGMPARMGLPTGERYLLPLCGPASVWDDCCHSQKHYFGAVRFWSALGIDPAELAARLWRVSGDVPAGERVLRRARQGIAGATRRVPNANGMSAVNRVERSGRQSLLRDRTLDGQSTASSGLVLTSGAGP